MNSESRNKDLNSLTSFLILECIAIISFALGGVNIIFYVVGALVAILAILSSYKKFTKNELKPLFAYMSIMLILSIFISFGNLLREGAIVTDILLLLALNLILFMGIAARRIKGFKPSTMLLTIGLSLALLVILSMLYTWIQYGLFYASIYKSTPIYYYNAELFDITQETGWLIGFSFKEVSLSYAGVFGVLLSSYLGGLFFINPKSETKKFILYAAIGLTGILSLISIPNLTAFAFIIPVILVAASYKYLRNSDIFKKILKYSLLVFTCLAFAFFAVAYLNASGSTGLTSFIASNGFLNRIFNSNGWMNNINIVLKQSSYAENLFGFVDVYANETAISTNTKMFEIELIKEGGIFALLVLLVFIVAQALILKKYLKSSNDDDYVKVIFLCMIVGFFLYSSFNYQSFPIVHNNGSYSSFFRSPLTLVMIFVLGYTYRPLFGKDELPIDSEKENSASNDASLGKKDDEYSFDEDIKI